MAHLARQERTWASCLASVVPGIISWLERGFGCIRSRQDSRATRQTGFGKPGFETRFGPNESAKLSFRLLEGDRTAAAAVSSLECKWLQVARVVSSVTALFRPTLSSHTSSRVIGAKWLFLPSMGQKDAFISNSERTRERVSRWVSVTHLLTRELQVASASQWKRWPLGHGKRLHSGRSPWIETMDRDEPVARGETSPKANKPYSRLLTMLTGWCYCYCCCNCSLMFAATSSWVERDWAFSLPLSPTPHRGILFIRSPP